MNQKLKKILTNLIWVLAGIAGILAAVIVFGGAIYLVLTFWDSFLGGFCKVSFVCWHGEPNWLGWILIGLLGFVLVGICFALVKTAIELIVEEADTWSP